MHTCNIKLQANDRLIFCSEGSTQSAMGSKELRLGLRRECVIEIIKKELANNPEISSHTLATRVVKQAI